MQDPASPDPTPPPVAADFPGNMPPRDMLMPALRSDAESFPVLKAFQDYIEAERERARRRLAVVSAVAIAAVVLVVAGFLAVGSVLIGNLMRRNDQLLESVMRFAERPAAPVAAAPAPQADAGEAELERMRALVQKLQQDQTAMQGSVAALQSLPATLATTMGQTLSNLVVASAVPGKPAAAAQSLPPAPATPFAPPNVLASRSPAAEPRVAPAPAAPVPPAAPPAALPATVSPSVASRAVPPAAPDAAATSAARAVSAAPVTISIPARPPAAPRIEGYAPSRMTLVTDRNVTIPWRIVVPE